MFPRVSIILTSFNHAKYLREAIDSVLNQTLTDYELIIWDDASTDQSWDIIQHYDDPRIRAFRNNETRRGVYGINKAISEVARGKYIAIHHSDDIWEPEKLEKQVAVLDCFPALGAVFTWARIIDDYGNDRINDWFNRACIDRWQLLRELFNGQNHLCHPSVLITTASIQKIGAYKFGLAQTGDAEMWSRLLLQFDIAILEEPLVRHRLFLDGSNTSGTKNNSAIRTQNEWNVLRRNFLEFVDQETFTRIFPKASPPVDSSHNAIAHALAMAALDPALPPSAWCFGLDILYRQLATSEITQESDMAFDYRDLVRTSGLFDTFGTTLLNQLAERDAQLAERDAQLASSWRSKMKDEGTSGQVATDERIKIMLQTSELAFSQKQKVFYKGFSSNAFAKFRTTYESINPDRPIETANVKYGETDPRFRKFLEGANKSTQYFVDDVLPHLGLFLHGPFPLPGNRVTTSAWDCRGKFGAYEAVGVLPKIAGSRVLDIGCNAGYDTFLMSSLGAIEAVGLEPHGFYHQACFLNAVYDVPGVSFMNLGWEDLDPRYFGGFDFVNCQGLIYHVKEPMLLIEKLASIMRPGATLLMETHVLSEESTQSQFIEGAFWGDETYWWIFGAECLMGMLRSAGFTDVRMPLKADCNSRNPANPRVTVEGHPAGARAWFVATRN